LHNVLVHEYTVLFPPKKFPEETWTTIYLGQDSDVFKSRIQIRSKTVQIRNTASKSYLEEKVVTGDKGVLQYSRRLLHYIDKMFKELHFRIKFT
jgi:hypothetical protein